MQRRFGEFLYQSSVLRWHRQKETVSEIFVFIAILMRLNVSKTLINLFTVIVPNFTKLILFITGEEQLLFLHVLSKSGFFLFALNNVFLCWIGYVASCSMKTKK